MNPGARFNKKYIHTFQIRTLRSKGYFTRVTLNNRTHTKPEWADSAEVLMGVFSNNQQNLGQLILEKKISTLQPEAKLLIEVDDLLSSIPNYDTNDFVVVFYLIPTQLNKSNDDFPILEKSKLWFYVTAQDHYVEYYIPETISTGVLYQCGAFNYKPFSTESNALIQAPKFYVSDEIDTYLSVIYTYFSDDSILREDALVKFKLKGDNGVTITWEQKFKPFVPYLITLKELLTRNGIPSGTSNKIEFFCLYALSSNATLLPLVFNHNTKSNALTVEHSLPPIYYGQELRGVNREKSIQAITNSGFFS
jgi:hypothetical protein